MLDHLNAIDLRLSHERARLAAAEANGFHNVIAWREHNVRMIERERAAEIEFLAKRGITVTEPETMSDDELLAALEA